MKKILLIFSILASLLLSANAVTFRASGPNAIPIGQVFNLVYTVNASIAKDLRVPEVNNNFDVLVGPLESHMSSFQNINGQVTASSTITYTYTLQPKKEGTFTIPPASIVVDDKTYTSNALTIRVLPSNKQAPAQSNPGGRGGDAGVSTSQKLSGDNIFVRAIPSKTRLFEQDYLLITYKLYSAVDIVGYTSKMPDFTGFLKQDIPLPQNKQLSLENYNGRNYSTVVLYQALLYPQQSGSIQIGKANIEAIVRVRTRAQVRSIFDDFFDTYQELKKALVAPAIKIQVDKLPANKPGSFSGAVGSFTFNSSISSQHVNVNDPITLKYTITGNGNLKLIKNPSVDFPTDFETYDPKVNNNFKNTPSGVSGTKSVEYLLIPRSAGEFTIPSYKFSYFDVKSGTYKETSTPVYTIRVGQAAGGGSSKNNEAIVSTFTNQEQLKLLGKDIRYIDTEKISVTEKDRFFFGSLLFWLLYIIPLLAAGLIFFMYRRYVKDNADVLSTKNKKANKVAIKRLKTANKFLHENKKELFYDEVLKALWGYLSDKLSIPVSALSKENVVDELTKQLVAETDIKEFMEILSECEFARYSPSTDTHAMDSLYERTIRVISKFQETIK